MKKKYVISDRKEKVWRQVCSEMSCKKLTDEKTGKCSLGHETKLHYCITGGCILTIAGNHKFCIFHRKEKRKTIMPINNKIMREFRSRMWGKKSENYDMEKGSDGRKEFEIWSQKQLETTYDKDVLRQYKAQHSLLGLIEDLKSEVQGIKGDVNINGFLRIIDDLKFVEKKS